MAADSDPPHKPASASDTPIMKQYQAAKARYPNALLFFRIGDFYELFYDDANTISRVLVLTLTSGSIHIQELQGDGALRAELARLSPTECVVPEELPAANGKSGPSLFPPAIFDGIAVSRLKPEAFDPREAHERIVARFSDSGR